MFVRARVCAAPLCVKARGHNEQIEEEYGTEEKEKQTEEGEKDRQADDLWPEVCM